ncbi:hypothetical protein XELAEV_18043610mg [Xenopus laevis]|uniref:Uncharacterized protein n=1 Tax=Xenopus laevis TaxID=8355 RepID=A0A974BX91_XENLA|nr:hypothetical protein XELAEV_18043610mg [Xenopus laevis]
MSSTEVRKLVHVFGLCPPPLAVEWVKRHHVTSTSGTTRESAQTGNSQLCARRKTGTGNGQEIPGTNLFPSVQQHAAGCLPNGTGPGIQGPSQSLTWERGGEFTWTLPNRTVQQDRDTQL